MTGRGGHITIGGQRVAVTEWGMTRVRPTPTDLDLLLAAVLAEPECDTRRLAYADALDERGGPGDAERAEFVRVQIAIAELERAGSTADPKRYTFVNQSTDRLSSVTPPDLGRLNDLRARERELYARLHPGVWPLGGSVPLFSPADGDLVSAFRRGFLDKVTCSAADFLRHADELAVAHPIERVTITDLSGWDARVALFDSYNSDGTFGCGKWPGIRFTLPPISSRTDSIALPGYTLANAVHVPPELPADAGGFGRSVIGQRINDAVNAFPPGTLAMGEPRRADDGSVTLPLAYTPPADPGPAAALDLCERCGREPVSRHFDGTRGPRGGWWLCADCHATATMEE